MEVQAFSALMGYKKLTSVQNYSIEDAKNIIFIL